MTKELLSHLERTKNITFEGVTSVKTMIACIAVWFSAAAFAVLVVIELVARLLPLLIVLSLIWLLIVFVRRKELGPQPPQTHPAAMTATPESSTPAASAPVTRGHSPALPPVTAAAARRYLIAGVDAGFNADRADGYLRLDPPHTAGNPPARHHQPALRQLPARRRAQRNGTTRP